MNYLKCLVYGAPGVGKTSLAATMPAPIFLSIEGGTTTLRAKNIVRMYGENQPDITYEIPVVEARDIKTVAEFMRWIVSDGATQYQSVVIDSLSELTEVFLHSLRGISIDGRDGGKKDARQDYGELYDRVIALARAIRDIPNKHVLVTAKLGTIKDPMGGVMKFGPAFEGQKLGQNIGYIFDSVYYMGVTQGEDGKPFRYLQTQPTAQYEAKDRVGGLEFYEAPHLGKIIQKLNEE